MNNSSHGESKNHLYKTWYNMKARCQKPNDPRFYDYGGRGIRVCEEWAGRNSYTNFRDWALQNGYEPGLTLERRNNYRFYTPDNCMWVTAKVNSNNTRANRLVTAYGETKTLAEWADDSRCNVSYTCFRKRLNRGWSVERALTQVSERAK